MFFQEWPKHNNFTNRQVYFIPSRAIQYICEKGFWRFLRKWKAKVEWMSKVILKNVCKKQFCITLRHFQQVWLQVRKIANMTPKKKISIKYKWASIDTEFQISAKVAKTCCDKGRWQQLFEKVKKVLKN